MVRVQASGGRNTRSGEEHRLWFTKEMLNLQRTCQNLEHKWHSTKLEVFHVAWNNSLLKYKNNPKFLFYAVAKLTQKQPTPVYPAPSAEDLIDSFSSKTDTIRDKIDGLLSTQCLDLTLLNFPSSAPQLNCKLSLSAFIKIVLAAKPSTCLLDPLPEPQDLLPILIRSILNIINKSLSTGVVPSAF